MSRFPLRAAVLAVAALSLAASVCRAQGDGARTYWKSLDGANAVTVWPAHMTGNANPLDPSQAVTPDADFEATLAIAGYGRVIHMLGRSAIASATVPVGSLQGEVSGVPLGAQSSVRGFGDPLVQLDVNLYGTRAIRKLPDMMRYEPRFTLDVLGSLALPIGEYDPGRPLNLGQNRWYGRLGFPAMLTIGDWVPGRRTTLELLPAVWLFGENGDHPQGSLKTDPLLQLEGHVTRDLTESFWASLDMVWLKGGRPEIDGVPGESVGNLAVGFTAGIKVNDNLTLSPSYMTSVADGSPGDLSRDELRLAITYGWHPLIESIQRMKGH